MARGGIRTGGAGASAGRVIAGTARGIRLVGPGEGTRPLGDRLKQSVFASLESQIRDRAFLDVFAGSGSAGIEALSRGAARAVFVERDPAAIRAIEANLATTKLADRATIERMDVLTWLGREGTIPGPFAIVFLDPPYAEPEVLGAAFSAIETHGPDGILAADGVVVAKHLAKATVPAGIGLLQSVRERRFGETALKFLRWASVGADDEGEEDR